MTGPGEKVVLSRVAVVLASCCALPYIGSKVVFAFEGRLGVHGGPEVTEADHASFGGAAAASAVSAPPSACTGRPIARYDGAALVRALGRPLVGMHRADLIGLLHDALPAGCLHTGTEVTTVTPDGTVTFRDGGTERPDLVVGADGIGSQVRAALWPGHGATAYAGSTAFRAIVDTPPEPEIGITWGPGAEFGIVPLAGGRRYWYAAVVAPEGRTHTDVKAYLQSRFSARPSVVRGLVDGTAADTILHHDIHVLARPLQTWVNGNVALVGDAAHAMTPFLGQGGCQAIEDAVVLTAATARYDRPEDALAHYDAVRRPRARSIVKASERMGRLGHRLRNPLLVAARNGAMRRVPGLPHDPCHVRPCGLDTPRRSRVAEPLRLRPRHRRSRKELIAMSLLDMKLPENAHTAQEWRIDEITPDFRLEDVWALPTPGGPDDLPLLVRQFADRDATKIPSRTARFLFAVRWRIGTILRWDDPAPGSAHSSSLRGRLPEDLRRVPGPALPSIPFSSLYLTDTEWAAELTNSTMQGVLHIGWVPTPDGGYRGQMAVLVKPRGLLGRFYMALILPFRYLIVYPPFIRGIGERWARQSGHQPDCD